MAEDKTVDRSAFFPAVRPIFGGHALMIAQTAWDFHAALTYT